MLDYLDDVASDMSVFHRVDDITELAGPVFFRLVWRLPAYAGVLQARQAAESQDAQPAASAPAFAYGGAPRDINPGTRATLAAEPAFQGIFSFG